MMRVMRAIAIIALTVMLFAFLSLFIYLMLDASKDDGWRE